MLGSEEFPKLRLEEGILAKLEDSNDLLKCVDDDDDDDDEEIEEVVRSRVIVGNKGEEVVLLLGK